MRHYMVQNASSLAQLQQNVEDDLNNGWRPLGGVSVTLSSNGQTMFYQALGKE